MRFAAIFGPKILKIFRGRKISRPKSREIAPKSAPPNDVQPRHDLQRFPYNVLSHGKVRRERLNAICSGFRSEIFEKLSRPKISRPKLREMAPKSAPPDDVHSGPQRCPTPTVDRCNGNDNGNVSQR